MTEFDEAFYLRTYADVRAAMARSEITSAFRHYELYGLDEGRFANAVEAAEARRQQRFIRNIKKFNLANPEKQKSMLYALENGLSVIYFKLAMIKARSNDAGAAAAFIAKMEVLNPELQNNAERQVLLTMLVREAVGFRDRGSIDDSLLMLKSLTVLAPGYAEPHVEFALILIHKGEYPGALQYIKKLNEAVKGDYRIVLMEARCLAQQSDFEHAILARQKIPSKYEYEALVWNDLRYELDLAISCWFVRTGANIRANLEVVGGANDNNDFALIFSWHFASRVSVERFKKLVQQTMFFGHLQVKDPLHIVLNYLVQHLADMGEEKQLVVFLLIVSLQHKPFADDYLKDPERVARSIHHPAFIKLLDLYLQRSDGDRSVFLEHLSQFFASQECQRMLHGASNAFDALQFPQAGVYAREVCARYLTPEVREASRVSFLPRSLAIKRPFGHPSRHLLVGVFGQIRFPGQSTLEIVDYLRSDLKGWVEAGNTVTYAGSTWSETGARSIIPEEPLSYLASRLPDEVFLFCQSLNVGNFSQFEKVFPSIARAIFARSKTGQIINEKNVRALFGNDDVLCDITSDAVFQRDIMPLVQKEFARQGILSDQTLNQGRMWHRIAALRPLVEAAQNARESDVTHVLLIRPDLQMQSGSFAQHLLALAERDDRTSVYMDADPHAHFVDGVGDRYFFGHVDAVAPLFHGLQAFEAILHDPELLACGYKDRLTAHRLALTMLYENGSVARPIGGNEISYRIYRGPKELADFSKELLEDSVGSPDFRAREVSKKWAARFV